MTSKLDKSFYFIELWITTKRKSSIWISKIFDKIFAFGHFYGIHGILDHNKILFVIHHFSTTLCGKLQKKYINQFFRKKFRQFLRFLIFVMSSKKNRWITPLLVFTKTKHFLQTRFFEKLPESCRKIAVTQNTKTK